MTSEASSSPAADIIVSDEDLETTLRVLHSLATADGGISDAYRTPRFKPLRTALQLYLNDASSRQFHGQKPDKYMQRKEKKRQQHARSQQERAIDRDAADKTRMRAERLRMLSELEQSAPALEGQQLLAYVPDGAVEADDVCSREPPRLTCEDRIGAAVDEDEESSALGTMGGVAAELLTLQACYTCKRRFRLLHHFYAHLCPECATLNYAKRMQCAPLAGRTFLLTGARVKIGFHIALKLLRCGANVLATSRFPADTATRYAEQPDYAEWAGRLRCYGLDLRDLSSIERFCAHLVRCEQRLDGIINNACQTIRRPAAYYAHLIPLELDPSRHSPAVRSLLSDHAACFGSHGGGTDSDGGQRGGSRPRALETSSQSETHSVGRAGMGDAGGGGGDDASHAGSVRSADSPLASSTAKVPIPSNPSIPSALWSQAPLWAAEEGVAQPDEGAAGDFPLGLHDVNGQQVDLRTANSWLLRIEDVSTPEAAEVLAINALAPFVINSRLR